MYVINIVAGAGAGKSTTAARVFSELKGMRVNAELVTEYAKELVWGNNLEALNDQLYILAKQNRRLSRIKGKVDIAVTDSPLFLNHFYVKKGELENTFRPLVRELCSQYNNLYYFIDRGDRPYNPKGRYQTEEVARADDGVLHQLLLSEGIEFIIIKSHEDIMNDLKLRGII